MAYSSSTFLKPLSGDDRLIQILDTTNNITHTIDPFSVINVFVSNNILKIGFKDKIISIVFSSPSESKEAVPLLQEQIILLKNKTPLYVDKKIENYVDSQNLQGPQGFQGNQGWQGLIGVTGYQGSQGLEGFQGSQGLEGPQGIPGPGIEFGSFIIGNASGTSSAERLSIDRKWPYGTYENGIEVLNNQILLNQSNNPSKYYKISVNFFIYNSSNEIHSFRFKLNTGSGFQNIGLEIPIMPDPSYKIIYVEELLFLSGTASLEFHRDSTNTIGPNYQGTISVYEIIKGTIETPPSR